MNKLFLLILLLVAFESTNAQSRNRRQNTNQSQSSNQGQQTKQCKMFIFSCPPTTALICNNNRLYRDLEESQGFEGIYVKDDKGCWRVSGNNQIPETKPSLIQRLRRVFGSNSVN